MDANYKPCKRYDDKFQRSAVALLETTGRPMPEVAGDLGIPCKTLERWRRKYWRAAGQAAVVGEKVTGSNSYVRSPLPKCSEQGR